MAKKKGQWGPDTRRVVINLVPCGLGVVAVRLTEPERERYSRHTWAVLVHRQMRCIPKVSLRRGTVDCAARANYMLHTNRLSLSDHAAGVQFMEEPELRGLLDLVRAFNSRTAPQFWSVYTTGTAKRAWKAYQAVNGDPEYASEFVLRCVNDLAKMPPKNSLTMRMIDDGTFGVNWANLPITIRCVP